MAEDGDHPDDEDSDAERDVVAEADAMADALEDELADAVTRPARELPRALVIPAAILVGAIAAPLTPDGFSFAQILYAAFLRHPLEGLITLLGFGSPFCFGMIALLLAVDSRRLPPAIGERVLVANLSLLHAQLFLVAAMLFARGQGLLPGALLGFATVSGGFFVVHHARTSAIAGGHEAPNERGPTQRWLLRWGATVIVAICGWMRLQMLIDVRFGWAIEAILGACVMMAVLLGPPRASAD
jgi:hypothetical protein